MRAWYTFWLILFTLTGNIYGQSPKDQFLLEAFLKVDKQKDWDITDGPRSFLENEVSDLKWELSDHFERFNAKKVYQLTCRFNRDSSLYEVTLITVPTQIQAFGLYSIEKSPSLEFFDIGFEAYLYGNKLVTWYGPFILFSEKKDTISESKDRLIKLMENFVKFLPKQKQGTPILNCLPRKNKVEHSEKYYAGHWLGQDFFKKVYYADYYTTAGYSRIFIIDNPNTASADTNFWNYYNIFNQNSQVLNDSLRIETDYFVINEPLWGRAILAKKNQIIYGILDYRNVDWTEERMAELLKELKDKKIVKSG